MKGERALSIGQTGSGKTTFNRWLLERLEDAPMVVYDTKHDDKFLELANHRVAESIWEADAALADESVDYVILRPPPRVTYDARILDQALQYHEEHWRGIPAYIDEVYHFHRGTYAGPGLTGLYTRGRSRGITTIASTQRPASISSFIFTESQLFYVFPIYHEDDHKRVGKFIRGFAKLPIPSAHHFYLYRQGLMTEPKLMPPVPVDEKEKLSYTDDAKRSGTAAPEPEKPLQALKVWL